MREIRSYGSVRGVAGDRYPYRDPEPSAKLAYRDLLVAAGEQEDIRQFFASDT
jgi:hypothetical protein